MFQEISIHDTLRFSETKGPLTLSVQPKGLTAGKDNLVLRALELLRKRLGVKMGMKVHLTKKIPVGAGLGGGSSDAAAALWAGWLIWRDQSVRPKRVPPVLMACARELGADVTFFLTGGTARAGGIGEKLRPLSKQPRRWLILVYPRVRVSTKLAYNLLDQFRKTNPSALLGEGRERGNSFEPVIFEKFPAVAQVKQTLIGFGCTGVMMTGSGSSVFGFVKNQDQGRQILRKLQTNPWDSHLVYTC